VTFFLSQRARPLSSTRPSGAESLEEEESDDDAASQSGSESDFDESESDELELDDEEEEDEDDFCSWINKRMNMGVSKTMSK
jgi:hypothetical protein